MHVDWSRLPKELKYFYEKDEKIAKSKRKAAAPKLVKRKIKKDNEMEIDNITEVACEI